MWRHESVWAAIDALAARHELSTSALAKKAGLDATAFNPSKRYSSDGRPRWPSTESISKVLTATGETLEGFVGLAKAKEKNALRPVKARSNPKDSLGPVPLLGFAQAGAGGFFDDGGFPTGQGWDEVDFPGFSEEGAYALEVSGESMLPLYRDGDVIIVSPSARVRKGDRVVVKTVEGEVMAKVLKRRTPTEMELSSLNAEHGERTVAMKDVAWMARILWASQ